MNEKRIFPRDPDTLKIIKELEKNKKLTHKDSENMSDTELAEYINKLADIWYKE